MQDGIDKCPSNRGHHKDIAHPSAHDDHAVRGLQMAASGHTPQPPGKDVRGTKEVCIKHLGHAAVVGDGLPLGQQVCDQFGGPRGGEADTQEGQVAEGKVHGLFTEAAAPDGGRKEQVS